MGAGEDNHRGKVPFSSCDIKNISCQLDVVVDTALDHLVPRHPSARPQPLTSLHAANAKVPPFISASLSWRCLSFLICETGVIAVASPQDWCKCALCDNTASYLPSGSVVKYLPANAGDVGLLLGASGQGPREGTTAHASVLAWRIPRKEEPGGI